MKVLISGRLPQTVIDTIAVEHEIETNPHDHPMDRSAILSRLSDKQGFMCMITDTVDADLLDHAPQLKMVANYGVGYNNIDLAAATARRIPVSNTPDVLTDATADTALALILACARRIIEGDRRTRQGRFKHWAPLHFLGSEVSGKTLGIIGLGRIGRAVCRRASGFGMQILYYNRHRLPAEAEARLSVSYADLDVLLQTADFVSLHVPLSERTHHLVGSQQLQLMKPSAYLINTSRGPVVDEKALVQALEEHRIGGAGLDVYENEPKLAPGLAEQDRTVLLPHIGSATIETRTRMAVLAADNLLAGLRGGRPPNCLNCQQIYGS